MAAGDAASAGTAAAPRRSVPANRWEATGGAAGEDARDRVARSNAQARGTLRLALAFLAGAAVAGAWGGERWLALHLLLAGGVVLAISGVAPMLTVTWSAAPAPPWRLVLAQRTCIAAGAAGVALARRADLGTPVVATAGIAYLAGLALLAWMLVATVRQGVQRRFDVAVAAYVAALVAGTAGAGLGIAMAADSPATDLRSAHVAANVLGLVGLVVAGTLPYFAATVGRSRMAQRATPRRLAGVLAWLVASLALTVGGLAAEAHDPATAGLAGYAAGILAVVWHLPRPTRRQLRWAGPRLAGLWLGAAWWVAAVVAWALELQLGDGRVLGARWTAVLVVAGFAQIVWGSVCYLLPVLRRGGHEQLTEGFARTRSWLGLLAANAAGLLLAAGAPGAVTGTVLAIWVVDSAWRWAGLLVGGARGSEARGERGSEAAVS